MAAAEPVDRVRELQFLLRMLTQSRAADLPPEPYASARSYPIGNWFRSAIEPSAADALNLAMAVVGPKAGMPRPPLEPMSALPHSMPATELIHDRPAPTTSTDVPPEMLNPATGKYEVIPRRGTAETATPEEIIRQTKEKGGYSVNLETGEVPQSGLMMGKFANADPRTRVLEGDPTMVDVTDWIKQNEKVLKGSVAEKQGLYAGTWKDDASGKTYLDVSKRFEPSDIRPATKFGERTRQISGYNVGASESFPVGDYPGFVTGAKTPEGVVPYSQRLAEMGQEGAGYLAQHPTADWWNTPDIQRVYGQGSRPQQAGLMGATSTNTQPRPNVQLFSEYMRRLQKGEPMVQPEFRIPPTAMGGAGGPGKSMGLEAGRSFNLQRAAEGNLPAMRGEVVREKTQALMGDPLAQVLDRIHVRLTEAPSAGVYATATEGKVPEGPQRQLIKDAIAKQASIEGKNPRQFSAEVWTGIREHIKRTGELYGQPFKATQRTTGRSESKSYNDLFVDLIAKKAKHLGISVSEMEAKLRSGDGELLSYLLATPFGAALYKRSRNSQ